MRHKIKEVSEVLFAWLSRIVQDDYDYTPQNLSEWSDKDWQVSKTIIFMHGMGPMWGYHITKGWTSKEMPADVLDYLEDQFYENTKRIELIHKEYKKIGEKLTEADIKFVPFKGIIMAEELYPLLGCRPMADIDIYTGPDSSEQVTAIMNELEFVAPATSPDGITFYPKKYIEINIGDDQKKKWVEITLNEMNFNGEHSSMPFSIDVHFSLDANRPWSKFNLTYAFNHALKSPNQRLDNNMTVVYILLHAAKHIIPHDGRWLHIYDLFLILRYIKIDTKAIADIGRELGVSHLLLLPLSLCRKIFRFEKSGLEQCLENDTNMRFRLLIERTELCIHSTCNPSDTLFSSMAWTLNFRAFLEGIKKSQRVVLENNLITRISIEKSPSFMNRLLKRIKGMIISQPKITWRLLAAHGLNPRKDWK